jgi:hypothetical protein
MQVLDTYKGNTYTFYLVDECHNHDYSPFGSNSICIPASKGMRTSCAKNMCNLCELSSGQGTCQNLISQMPANIHQLFPKAFESHPEYFI